MLKTEIIIIAIAISWFLCSERPETSEQPPDGGAARADDGSVTETVDDAGEGQETLKPDIARAAVWLKLGAITVLSAIVLAVI